MQAEADDPVIAGAERAEWVFLQDRAERIDERFQSTAQLRPGPVVTAISAP